MSKQLLLKLEKHIDFGRKETWPDGLNQLVFNQSEKISIEKKAEWENIQSGKAHYNFVEMPTYNKVKSEIEGFLLDSKALAWHCTKLLNTEKIKRFGLRPLSIDLLNQLVQEDLSTYLVKEDQEKILKKISFYREHGYLRKKENRLWFLLNREMYRHDDCKEFLNFFGGEALRKIIENDLPRYKSVFQSVGKPYLIEFHVELNQIGSYQLSNLAKELIDFGVDTLIGEKTPFLEAEGKISIPVPGERIHKFIELERNKF
jgi:hypothetical protein